MSAPATQRFALWALGFRPFYLLAAVFAALSVVLWVLQYSGVGGTAALRGIITEGDLRRAYSPDMFGKRARDIMTATPVTVTVDALVRDAVALMTEKRIANVIVLDGTKVVEVLDTKDLMQRGYL